MTNKNPWHGMQCSDCDQTYHDEYISDPLFTYSSAYETLMGRKLWTCGKCCKASLDEMQAIRSRKKGIVSNKIIA